MELAEEGARQRLTIRLFGAFTVERNGEPLSGLNRREGKKLLAFLVLHHGQEIPYRTLAERFFPAEARSVAEFGGDYPATRQAIYSLRLALGPDASHLRSVGKGVVCLDLTGMNVDLLDFDRAAGSDKPGDWERAIALYRGPVLEGWSENWIVPPRNRRQRDYDRILRQSEQKAVSGDPVRERPPSLDNLPVAVTSFVGREKEIEEVCGFLSRTRLLTLTGAGGCGKTRLALQCAARVRTAYPQGVWYIELAALSDAALLPQTVAHVLAVQENSGETILQTVIESLKGKSLLLILDNCEHILSACASLATALLRSCPHVRILATSRERLGVAGELTYRVPSLSSPSPHQVVTVANLGKYDSARLFIERALFHQPELTITNPSALALAQLCHRLDGIPLALELAAARTRSLSVEEINERLDGRFRLLTGGDRSALPRHQTLRALVDWSYELLTDAEKALLARLSVFAGGWTLAAAEQVCGFGKIEAWEILDLLTGLVDKSLVLAEGHAGETRYRMLETIRAYASERLPPDERVVLQQSHLACFLALAEQAEPQLRGPEQATWFSLLETEHDNLRTALTASYLAFDVTHGKERGQGLRLAGALRWFWEIRGYFSEGRDHLTRALAGRETATTAAVAKALNALGNLLFRLGDYAAMQPLFEESLALYRSLGDKRNIAILLNNLSMTPADNGDFVVARSLLEENLTYVRELNDPGGIALVLNNLGVVVGRAGDNDYALSLLEESLSICRTLGDSRKIAEVLNNLGTVYWQRGDGVTSRSYQEESLRIYAALRDTRGVADCLEEFSLLCFSSTGASDVSPSDVRKSIILRSVATALRKSLGSPLAPYRKSLDFDPQLAKARAILGETDFQAAWSEGNLMDWNRAVEFALERD